MLFMSTTFESLPTEKTITTSSRYTIRQVETEEEREAVYRFRYKVYIEEMGRPQKYADHTNRRICEPLDDKAIIIAAFDSNQNIIGTVRKNFASDGDLGFYQEWYGMAEYAGNSHPKYTSITTKMMISPEYRNTYLIARMSIYIYVKTFEREALFDFIDCNHHLEKFFTGLGYYRYRDEIYHHEYGQVIPMVGSVRDLSHLKNIKSPLAKHCEELLTRHLKEN